jgi:uncharacterized protein YjbI with pentapeptide repeats
VTGLNGANLTHALLSNATIASAGFNGANLTKASLLGATITTSGFDSAIFRKTICPDGTNSDDHGDTCAGHGI